jgi:hypothetical protein
MNHATHLLIGTSEIYFPGRTGLRSAIVTFVASRLFQLATNPDSDMPDIRTAEGLVTYVYDVNDTPRKMEEHFFRASPVAGHKHSTNPLKSDKPQNAGDSRRHRERLRH